MLRVSIRFDLPPWRRIEWFLRERFANFSLDWLKVGRQYRPMSSPRYRRTFANKTGCAQLCDERLKNIFRLVAQTRVQFVQIETGAFRIPFVRIVNGRVRRR
ncbi:MAG: hypothetical protein DME71_04780 [Verrucomicrobia bacterium]|nr:MAG: hypothetical protein DME71_04780 [Verrucomicrobiota bacterium]